MNYVVLKSNSKPKLQQLITRYVNKCNYQLIGRVNYDPRKVKCFSQVVML